MKKDSRLLTILRTLMLVTITLESLALLNTSAFGIAVEVPWFRQWPFSADAYTGSSEAPYGFAYNGSHVELVVGFHEENQTDQKLVRIINRNKGSAMNRFSWSHKTKSIVASVPTGEVAKLLEGLVGERNVDYVEPNWDSYIDASVNDPRWMYQWGAARIEADKAWNVQKGDSAILVAVVDTGISYDHPDLKTNYVPLGYDWVNNDTDPMDDNGHGTHCAGIIAAALNNSIGVAGLAQVRIMAEKALTHNGAGYDDDLAKAIIHAADQGARIISCSWGSNGESQLLHDAVQYATNAGALVVAAAGNSGTKKRHYPAAYPEVISVTATDENDRPAAFTTYGDWVDLAAPGTSIFSTYLWNSYLSMSGTSMACPYVAGVAALVWSQYPAMSNEQVRNQLLYTADDLGTVGFDVFYGFGRVNARKAVEQTVALTGSGIVSAPANSVYFMHVNPTKDTSAATAYDTIASGVVYGLTANSQRQEFASNSRLILESGRLNTSALANATVVLFGGPCPQETVRYYENAGMTPVKFEADETSYKFLTQNGQTIAELSRGSVDSGREDMFVVEVLTDGTDLIVIMYGFSWEGTWASGIFFKEIISKSLNWYAEKYYVFHWIDGLHQDGIPESGEIHQEAP